MTNIGQQVTLLQSNTFIYLTYTSLLNYKFKIKYYYVLPAAISYYYQLYKGKHITFKLVKQYNGKCSRHMLTRRFSIII